MLSELRAKLHSRTLVSSAFAIVLALSSTAALASAAGYDGGEDDDSGGKTEACKFIGCANGNRVCGSASGKISSGAPPFVGEISVSWTCYEASTYV